MATILDDEDTVEAHALSTSLDPYGQLVKMLMPRALCITIYDRNGMPLWLSDGCEGPDLLQIAEEALNAARSPDPDPEERHGFARSWNGDTAYVFILRDRDTLLGAVALSCRDSSSGSRPFSLLFGLLRPAIDVLSRELANQYNVSDSQKHPVVRENELALLLETSVPSEADGGDDFQKIIASSVTHLDCAFGALLIPDKKIAVCHSATPANRRADLEMLERTQRHLFAWAQVQRRTLALNKAPPNSPLGTLPYKILACPARLGNEPVTGILVLFRPMEAPDFNTKQVRVVELVARRIAHALQNTYDPASGLLTRAGFEQRARTTLAAAPPGANHCVAYGDVDRLHLVNDNFGMHVGDAALERIATTIRASLPAGATASRLSGDRFALFFANTPLATVERFIEKLRTGIASIEFSHNDQRIPLSVGFGIATVPQTKLPLSHALAAAEAACKAEKSRARAIALNAAAASKPAPAPAAPVAAAPVADEPVLQDHEIFEVVRQHAAVAAAPAIDTADDDAMLGSLREAIANDRFRMEAQPIIELGAGTPARRFELLLRMIDAAGESVAPGKFLCAAERGRIATGIDRWVVQYALEILSSAAPALQRLNAHFAINISGQSVGDETFPAFLEGKLREYALPAGLLSFEISETAAVANIVHAETLIRRLQDLGHDIALDDFGRGLSSLQYLKSLPVCALKVDGELIRDLVGNARSQATVNAIVQLAQSKQLRTTAKSVESDAILDAVAQLGLDYGQGFAIGRPQPLEVVLQELLRGSTGTPRAAGAPFMTRLAG